MQAAEPFLRALWDMTNVGDSHEGLETLIMALLYVDRRTLRR
jgi:hypothetical protein